MLTLYPDQDKAVAEIRKAYREGVNSVFFVGPTGMGKTVIFTYIAQAGSAKGKRILMTAHRKELIDQISDALRSWGVHHGIISPHHKENNAPIQVASVQTLSRRVRLDKKGRYRFDLVVIDEAHHAGDRRSSWGQVLEHNAGAKLLAVSASPCRLDGKPLGIKQGGFFEKLIIGPTVLDLIEAGRLCPPVVYAPQQAPDLSGVRTRRGDYDTRQLEAAMDKNALTGDAVSHYRRHADRVPAIAFCITVAHAAHVAEQFKAAGYQAAVLTGETPKRERERMILDLGRGALHVLANCNVMTEGVDVPMCGAAIFLRPTQSLSLYIQMAGRVLRTYPGKERAVLLDHAGNVHRHGLPTDEVQWSLESKPKRGKEKGPPVKQCPECWAVVGIAVERCPECGHTWERDEGPGREAPETVDGELTEIDAVAEARRRRAEVAAARTQEDLERIARERGYKRGWVFHVMRERESRYG